MNASTNSQLLLASTSSNVLLGRGSERPLNKCFRVSNVFPSIVVVQMSLLVMVWICVNLELRLILLKRFYIPELNKLRLTSCVDILNNYLLNERQLSLFSSLQNIIHLGNQSNSIEFHNQHTVVFYGNDGSEHKFGLSILQVLLHTGWQKYRVTTVG